jgi:GAF domain-containing protein
MGQRLSGWVAANRQTIVNSDPMLDLGEVARALKPPLRSCLSTPLMAANELVGVLTVYSTHREAFTEDHRRLVEVVARQVSQTVKHAVDFSRDNAEKLRDQLTGLPNRQHLERFVASELAASADFLAQFYFGRQSQQRKNILARPLSLSSVEVADGFVLV